MLYENNDDLPSKIKNVLLEHVQDIYREAFNHPFDTYKTPEKRKTS